MVDGAWEVVDAVGTGASESFLSGWTTTEEPRVGEDSGCVDSLFQKGRMASRKARADGQRLFLSLVIAWAMA